MNNYLRKIHFQNQNITSVVKAAIDKRDLLPPNNRPYLESRKQFKITNDTMQYTGEIHNEKVSEVARRLDRAVKLHGPRITTFVQYSVKPELKKIVYDCLPANLSKLTPTIAVQFIYGGQACTPHRDHSKKSSMFYLYTEPDVKTVWWEKISDFEEFDDFKYGDPDKLKLAHEEVIETGHWYVFNNEEFHSIHLLEGKLINRISLLLEFDVTATELIDIIKNG